MPKPPKDDLTGRSGSWPPSPHRLDAMIEEATVDAYGESEQATAFLTTLEEFLPLPFVATVLGEAVTVEKIDISGADELIAICRRRWKRQKVRLWISSCLFPGRRAPNGSRRTTARHVGGFGTLSAGNVTGTDFRMPPACRPMPTVRARHSGCTRARVEIRLQATPRGHLGALASAAVGSNSAAHSDVHGVRRRLSSIGPR